MSRADAPLVAFNERELEADGIRIRYLVAETSAALETGEAGSSLPLVMLLDGGLSPDRAHELLAQHCRVIAVEVPDVDASLVDDRPRSTKALARTLRAAIAAIGLRRYALMGSAVVAPLAAWLAIDASDAVEALVLVAPEAVLPDDPELEAGLRALQAPALVIFGTKDRVTPPELGRTYNEIMPRCHFVLVYDAGHAVAEDRPEALALLVGDFVARGSQFVTSASSSLLNP